MKQILQHLKTGKTTIEDVPAPQPKRGNVLIQTSRSLISAGTERMLVEFSQAGLLGKAKAQPDKVKEVIDKVRSEGLLPTLERVFSRLDEPLPLGYCNAGTVIEAGSGVTKFKPGDRVVSNGPHAEIVCVPENLCAKIPDNVSDEQASFTVLSSIGLQGIRLADPTLGETVVVYGLGLIGMVTVQLLIANGCNVIGIDINESRLKLAEAFGARTINAGTGGDPVTAVSSWTDARGADAVLITASAKTDDIVHQAAAMSRKRGRIILVGVVNLNLRREDFYDKELSFQVSCSYGPGRYDDKYEQQGQDYPAGFVRWTEQRNFEAVLDLLNNNRLNLDNFITHRFPLNNAANAYEIIQNEPDAFGVVLEYPDAIKPAAHIQFGQFKHLTGGRFPQIRNTSHSQDNPPTLAVIGAGNFTKMTLAPALQRCGARLKYLCGHTNTAATAHVAQKYHFENATTDINSILSDNEVDAVIIATGHNSHVALACNILEAGKHAFVEKPLALNPEELSEVITAARGDDGPGERGFHVASNEKQRTKNKELETDNEQAAAKNQEPANSEPGTQNPEPGTQNPKTLTVGFNRRFSPHIVKAKKLLRGHGEPLAMNFTINAGYIPPDEWVHDPEKSGGRIVGEACHFFDLMAFLTDSSITSVAAHQMEKGAAVKEDKMSISLGLEDGSVGTVNYFANGSKSYPKETLEIFSDQRVLRINNFRVTRGYGFKGFRKFRTKRHNKGHEAEFQAFVNMLKNGREPLIPLDRMINVTLASFAAVTAAAESRTVNLSQEYETQTPCQ